MLTKLNQFPRRYRWPIKWAMLALTGFLICYPYPHLFARHVARWSQPNRMIDPESPALRPLVDELRIDIDRADPPGKVLKKVERYVCKRIPYAYDWDTWGVADYLPTVDEALRVGREDCDGRAVVAASLMRKLGYHAELVTDFAHVWVKTDHGDYLGPRPTRVLVVTDRGLEIEWGWALLSTTANAMAFGVAIFPALREMLFVAVLWVTLVDPRRGRGPAVLGGALLFGGLLLLRAGGHNPHASARCLQWLGFAQVLAGAVVMAWLRPRIHSAPTHLKPQTPRALTEPSRDRKGVDREATRRAEGKRQEARGER